jgi:cytochrome d ubiquinol oxidase subunit I
MLFALIGLVTAGLYYWKGKIFNSRLVLWVLVVNVVLTEIAITSGWWTTEIGRQPWVVWNLLRTEDAVSPTLTTEMVAATLATFVVLYLILLALFLYLLNAKIHKGPAELEELETGPISSLPDSLREVFRRPGPRTSTGAAESIPTEGPP